MFTLKRILQYCTTHSKSAVQNIYKVRNLPQNIVDAGKIGLRYSQINNYNIAKTLGVTSLAITQKGLKPHLPGLLAGAGLFSPIPFGSVAGFGAGKVLQRLI